MSREKKRARPASGRSGAIDARTLVFRSRLHQRDLQSVLAIVASSNIFNPVEIRIAGELVQERLARGASSGYHFIFGEIGKQVAGYCCFGPIDGTDGRFDLYWIAVHADFRHKGIGGSILRRSEHEMIAMGARKIYAETSSKPAYGPTRSFYLRNGFRLAAEIESFYSDGDNKIIYVKDICNRS
jgi:ribosomal protein S18 acetylase RimI-like enzyme